MQVIKDRAEVPEREWKVTVAVEDVGARPSDMLGQPSPVRDGNEAILGAWAFDLGRMPNHAPGPADSAP